MLCEVARTRNFYNVEAVFMIMSLYYIEVAQHA